MASLINVHLLRTHFCPSETIIMNVVMLRDFGLCGIFMTMCVYYFRISVILDGQISSININNVLFTFNTDT
jgi:hypothetical protein